MAKNLYLVSLGCPKNLVDSEIILAQLSTVDYTICHYPEEADLLLINTCGFIQSAVEEAIEQIILLGQVKLQKPGTRLVVCGCMVQRYKHELIKELPEVDLFVGVDGCSEIARLVDQLSVGEQRNKIILPEKRYLMDSRAARKVSTPSHRAYLKISEGCSNRCSYCLIPSIRGPLRSRHIDDLAREADRLCKNGVKELTLIGQDVTSYGIDLGQRNTNLYTLIKKILSACTVQWLRLLYLYPNRISDDLLALMAEERRLLNYLDIPLQHISSKILKQMNRPFTAKEAHNLVERILNKIPDAAIRTTFIVGFPGETDRDIEEVALFLKTYKLSNVGIFTYSNEEGCAAEFFPDQCPENVKQERYDYLMNLQSQISLAKNKEFVGKTIPVLVEGYSSETDLLLEGRAMFQAPEIDGCVYITDGQCAAGDIVPVKITEAHPYDLVGEIS